MVTRGLKPCVVAATDGFCFMIGSLTARIFAIFWLTLALVLMLVLMLPSSIHAR